MNAVTYTTQKLYTNKVLDISTGHITENDNKLLTKDECPVSAYKFTYGFLVNVPHNIESVYKDTRKAIVVNGFSDAFQTVFELARKNQCDYIMFDCDGITYEDLPVFDW